MNPKVKELIDKKKAEHLISLGLIGGEETPREYLTSYKTGAKYDPAKGYYFGGNPLPIEISDEEYEELCKHYPVSANDIQGLELQKNIKEIRLLILIWSIVMVVSLVLSLIALFSS